MAEYLTGVALLAVLAGSLGVGAVSVRARLVPGWAGAPARLVEVLVALALLVGLGEVLGAFGLLLAVPFVLGAVFVGAGVWGVRAKRPGRKLSLPTPDRLSRFLAAGAVAAVAADWALRTRDALAHGMANVDSLWYHGPYAARFAQDGDFAAFAYTQPDPVTPFYPALAELVHAIGIVLLGHDTLSPLLNLGWLGLALLAAWCIGRPYGAQATSVLALATVAGSYVMVFSQAGEATNDMAGLALFLGAVALVASGDGDRRALALAALPAGLAVGTKVSLLAPVLALFAGLLVLSGRGARRTVALSWAVVVPVAGGFWYARNLVATGNPLPWLDLGPLPSIEAGAAVQAPATGWDTTLAHLLGQDGGAALVRAGLRYDLGPLWWAIAAAALAGLVAGLAWAARQRGDWPDRVLGIVASAGLVSAAAYLFTPQSGTSFVWNVRHATPALALGLIALALLPPLRTRTGRPVAALLLTALFVSTQFATAVDFTLAGSAGAAAAATLAAAGAWALAARKRGGRAIARASLAGLLVAGLLTAGYFIHRDYLDGRYTDPTHARIAGDEPLRRVYAWARGVEDARIAVFGTQLQYPLYGRDLSNRVRYLHRSENNGREVRLLATCEKWREAIVEGDVDYVVTTPVRHPFGAARTEPREARWTRSLRGVRELERRGEAVSIFRLDGPPGPCPRP